MKVLQDKDFTKEDRQRIAERKKARKGAPYMLSTGSRRMIEIDDQNKKKMLKFYAGNL